MKLHYVMMVGALTAAMAAVFLLFNPVTAVSAENTSDYLASEPQISALVSLTVPPYKR
jgi:hypothetical protein